MDKQNILLVKTDALTNRIIKMVKYLRTKHVESSIVTQVLRAGTSIGANIAESQNAQSRADFVNKLSIALKEADETVYWIDKLLIMEGLTEKEHRSIMSDTKEVIYMLTAIIKKTKQNNL